MVKKISEPKTAKKETKELKPPTYYYAIGRRKEAVARVRFYVLANETEIKLGDKTYTKGQIVVNDRPIEKYFSGEIAKKTYLEPLRTTNTLNRFAITIRTIGGGLNGQLEAVVQGFARVLEKIDKEKFRPILKKRGFMSRDSRAKQRRNAGFAGKARKRKQSPKR